MSIKPCSPFRLRVSNTRREDTVPRTMEGDVPMTTRPEPCNPPSPSLERHVFPGLSRVPGLVHGIFKRHGGVSLPPYAALNVAWNNGDNPRFVHENLSRIEKDLGLDCLAAGRQVHGDRILLVDENALGRAETRGHLVITPPGDALVTRLRGVGLLIKIADCQAVFLVDPVQNVVANVHCGWRGSVQELPAKVVRFLRDRLGCRPEDLLAAVSPSLGPCCAEFRNYRTELPASFAAYQAAPLHFDFWAVTRGQLEEAGVRSDRIEIAQVCTVCESRDYFSYRGEKVTGRNAAVIGWQA